MQDKYLDSILDYLDTSIKLSVNKITLTADNVRKLREYIDTQNEKIKQLKDLISYLNGEIINLTEEINKIEL